jgi:hypothetical protein
MKAYDIKALGQAIKDEAAKQGLTLAEEAVETLGKAAWVGTKSWASESAKLSKTKLDDLVVPFLDTMDKLVEESIEKVDLDGDESFVIALAISFVVGCKVKPLKIDPCAVYPNDPRYCYAVPINQPGKDEYDRLVQGGDICITAEEYTRAREYIRQVRQQCGE